MIQDIEDGAFAKLLLLEELSLAENFIKKLPALPPKLTSLNANQNKIISRGIKANAFKVHITMNDIQEQYFTIIYSVNFNDFSWTFSDEAIFEIKTKWSCDTLKD